MAQIPARVKATACTTSLIQENRSARSRSRCSSPGWLKSVGRGDSGVRMGDGPAARLAEHRGNARGSAPLREFETQRSAMVAEAVVVVSRQAPGGAPWVGVFLTEAAIEPSSWLMRA